MPKNRNRPQRVADLIQAALANILQRDAKNLRFGLVTIISVTVAHDLSFAKVYVSVLDESKAVETVKALNHSAKYFRTALAGAVKLRIAPELKFIYDDSIVRGSRITSLINEALDKK